METTRHSKSLPLVSDSPYKITKMIFSLILHFVPLDFSLINMTRPVLDPRNRPEVHPRTPVLDPSPRLSLLLLPRTHKSGTGRTSRLVDTLFPTINHHRDSGSVVTRESYKGRRDRNKTINKVADRTPVLDITGTRPLLWVQCPWTGSGVFRAPTALDPVGLKGPVTGETNRAQ